MRRLAAVAALAANGVVAGHALAYALAHSDPVRRAEALDGHGYLPALAAALLPAGVGALVWLTRHRRPGRPLVPVATLAAAQVVAFAALETAERALAGRDPLAVLGEPAVVMGLVLQAPLALLVVTGLARVGGGWPGWTVPRGLIARLLPVAVVPIPVLVRPAEPGRRPAAPRGPPRRPDA